MSGIPPCTRKASLEDFFIEEDGTNSFTIHHKNNNSKNNHRNHKQNHVVIAKNQQEFGHKKRIKP